MDINGTQQLQPQRLSTSPYGANRAQRRKANHDQLRDLTAHKRKSAVHKHMDRPEKSDRLGRGWMFFDAVMRKAGLSLAG